MRKQLSGWCRDCRRNADALSVVVFAQQLLRRWPKSAVTMTVTSSETGNHVICEGLLDTYAEVPKVPEVPEVRERGVILVQNIQITGVRVGACLWGCY